MADIIGKVFLSQFRVDAFIAAGGMGAVYRVWDIKRNVPLAMKVLHSELAEDPSMFKRFQREARALQKLAHPNIVPFYGLYQTLDMAFMLERFVDGPSLKDVLKRNKGKPLTTDETLTYIKALSAALGYAHANGVVHCDVKPGNVMIDRGGNIYLTDFGIARHAESATTTFAAAGTAAYMPPEQIKGEMVSPATDVYALGVILYEMVTGKRPFRGGEMGTSQSESGATLNIRIRQEQLHVQAPDPRDYVPTIAPELAGVVLKSLSKRPEDRFASATAFFDAVCRAMGVSPMAVKEHVRLADVSEKPDYANAQEVVKGAALDEPSRAGRLPSWAIGVAVAGVLGCFVFAMIGGLFFVQGSSKSGGLFGPSPTFTPRPTSIRYPTRTPAPPLNTPDYAVRTAAAILTRAASVPVVRPTNTRSSSSSSSYSAIRACIAENSPARKGPGTGYQLTDWAQKNDCYWFDARSTSSYSSLSDVWIRFRSTQEQNSYFGLSWIRADKVRISVSNVNSLPVVRP